MQNSQLIMKNNEMEECQATLKFCHNKVGVSVCVRVLHFWATFDF